MNRRTFTQALTAATMTALVAPAVAQAAQPIGAAPTSSSKFPDFITLWTVFETFPSTSAWPKRLKPANTNVELVGEYRDWSPDDFTRSTAARKRLGITFDATAGLKNGVGNPATRDALLAELPMNWSTCRRSAALQ